MKLDALTERRLLNVSGSMTEILASGIGLKRDDLVNRLLKDPYIQRNIARTPLVRLVNVAINIYPNEFYTDPSTRKVYLTKSAKDRIQREMRQPKRRTGTTSAAIISDAMEAKEAMG